MVNITDFFSFCMVDMLICYQWNTILKEKPSHWYITHFFLFSKFSQPVHDMFTFKFKNQTLNWTKIYMDNCKM